MFSVTTLLSAVLLAAPAAPAAEKKPAETLAMGPVELTLGMPQDEAKAELEKHCVLEEAPHTRSFFVYEKTEEGKGRSLGSVEFEDAKLTSITRERWASGNGDAADLAKTVADILGALVQEGRTSCTLESDSPSSAFQVVTIRCDRKHVGLVVMTTGPDTKVVVTEMLR
jgi:hypothetical protein